MVWRVNYLLEMGGGSEVKNETSSIPIFAIRAYGCVHHISLVRVRDTCKCPAFVKVTQRMRLKKDFLQNPIQNYTFLQKIPIGLKFGS